MNNWDKSIKAITSAVDRTDYLYEKWAKKLGVNNYVSRIMYMLYLIRSQQTKGNGRKLRYAEANRQYRYY